MASIKAKLSSVELYTSQCGDDYSIILNIANDVLSRAEKLYIIVQEELEKISRQLNRVQRSYDDIQHKVTSYMQRMEDAANEIERLSEKIEYIYNHPSTVTSTDDEGNETTEEVIDYDAIRAAERERDAARSTYNLYENKLDEARMVLKETGYTVSKFQNTKYGIEAVSRSIQNDIYEIKKYIRAIDDEAEFNIHSLQGVMDSLQSYLASKAIFMPEGSYYEEFASVSVGGSSVIKGSTSSVEETNSNNSGAELGKKIVKGVKTAVSVAAAAIASTVPSPADDPQQQYIDATPKTEIARSIDHYNSGNPKQERLNQGYLELEERRKKEESEVIPNADVSADAGGDIPEGETNVKYIYDQDGIPISIETYANVVAEQGGDLSFQAQEPTMYDNLHDPNLFDKNAPGDYTYESSDSGKKAYGSLAVSDEGVRDAQAQRNAGGEDRKADDDGGHLIGTRFNGAPDSRNLDAQNANLNRGSYNHREKSWQDSINNGDKVYVNIETPRSNGSERPDAYMGYSITEHYDGSREWDAFSYQNASKAEQEAWNRDLDTFDSQHPEDYNNPMQEVYDNQGYKNNE